MIAVMSCNALATLSSLDWLVAPTNIAFTIDHTNYVHRLTAVEPPPN